ncbi:uncharacterized protein LOC105433815 [Pogonomyrmex barbatus]|uniref:Uncharacterized protein LOC105433815 n=1 Tax=Pogonomyrmex barbatus TaxID=144034 RepID=A0A6I9XNC2_9HYME|nr:uncharacterized protein LOC105433815 [Pogonomyrmex barbatus]XP_011647571.1 uncharacterized protein LOC105433815 [Pogonomyrmex barbatus]
MTLPVSSYEELLIQVRELTHETILLQRQLSSDLFDNADPPDVNHNFSLVRKHYEKGKLLVDNAIRHCDKTQEIEAGQNSFAECNNLRFRPQYRRDLDSIESARSGELTSRLLAWRSRDRHPIISQVSDAAPGRRTHESVRAGPVCSAGVNV